jgi:uncharacterized protein involved in exopolysaccharide biosynthesis
MPNAIDRTMPQSLSDTVSTGNHQMIDDPPVLSLARLAAELLRNRRMVIGVPVALGILAVSITLLQRPTYTANASFVSQQGDSPTLARVSGLAAQFGVNLPQGRTTDVPAFYADMLTSRPILAALVDSGYQLGNDTARTAYRLSSLFDVGDRKSEAVRRELTMQALRKRMIVSTDVVTGTIRLAVQTQRPDLSAAIARRAIALVNEFNIRLRQSQAENQAAFFDSRLKAARDELDRAEDRLQAFLTSNRSFSNDSRLQFEHDRLSREVQLRQQMYLGLYQSYEQSRLERLKDVPILSVVEEPEEPALPDRRYTLVKAIGAALFGFVFVTGVIVGRQVLRSNSRARDDVRELTAAFQEAAASWRRFGRRNP